MAKIVYGVSGEGSGHSSRALEMINHLEQKKNMAMWTAMIKDTAALKTTSTCSKPKGFILPAQTAAFKGQNIYRKFP